MSFQYFFFDTYYGYFLQALPITLLVEIIYYFIKFKNDKKTKTSKKILSCMFVTYIVGLVCLTVGLDTMNIIWYKLIYNMDPGTKINWYKFHKKTNKRKHNEHHNAFTIWYPIPIITKRNRL